MKTERASRRWGKCKTCDEWPLRLIDGARCRRCRVLCFGPESVDDRGRAVRPASWDESWRVT